MTSATPDSAPDASGGAPARLRDAATPLDVLVALLDLEPIEVNLFRGHTPKEERLRVFGGQVAAQALVAASRTVEPDRVVHSLHAYFLRPGDVRVPIVYQVDRIRDGKSFTTRRVVAIQHGEAIFHLSASFHVREDGRRHALPMPDVPEPLTLPTLAERYKGSRRDVASWITRPRAFDQRYVYPLDDPEAMRRRRSPMWMKANGTLPDDPLLHMCAVAYASDMSLIDTALIAHPDLSWENGTMAGASLDHAMWFHDEMRADEWFLYDQESTWAGGARGLARGEIYSADGRLCVSVVQEGLIRPVPPRGER